MASKHAASIARVQKAVVIHYSHAKQGVSIMALLGPPNEQALRARDGVNPAIQALLHVALMEKLHLMVMRMHDKDADGLRNIFRLLEEPEVRLAVLAPSGDHHLAEARSLWARIETDQRFDNLRVYRDSVLAHLVTQKWGGNREVVNLFACAQETFVVVEELERAIGALVGPLQRIALQWQVLNLDFWARLSRAPK